MGHTSRQSLQREAYLPVKVVLSELRKALTQGQRIDYISFSDSREPTFNSKIGTMIRAIKGMTTMPLAVLTKRTFLYRDEVLKDLRAIDLVVPSLDAVSPHSAA